MNGRTALGACFVLLAILGGATFLDRAQRLVPVYAAARDLPTGVPLSNGDLMVVRVRLPEASLRHYLRPGPGQDVAGRVLAAPLRRETLVPAELVLASNRRIDLVELPVQVDPGDMAEGLRPGDSVQVVAAFTEGARRGRAVVLLPSAEVVQVLEDATGLTGAGQRRGVQLRMPSDRAPAVAAAIATARIFVVKAPGPATLDPAPPADLQEPPPEQGTADPDVPGAPDAPQEPPAATPPSPSDSGVPGDAQEPSPATPPDPSDPAVSLEPGR
jgi:hypothetical protein